MICLQYSGFWWLFSLILTRDKLNHSHNFSWKGTPGFLQSSLPLKRGLIRAGNSEHVLWRLEQLQEPTMSLASLFRYLTTPPVFCICFPCYAAFAVLGAEFAMAKMVHIVYWMGTYPIVSEEKTASAVLTYAPEMFNEEQNTRLLN